jgi:hypothetical protein
MTTAVTDLEIVRQSPEETARTLSIGHYRAAYGRGMSFSQHLENLDPTVERAPADRHGDAFDRVVAALGVVVNPVPEMGLRASTFEEATDTPQKRAIMPELAARWWKRAARLPVSAGIDKAEMAQLMNANEDLDGYDPSPTSRAILLSGDAALGSLVNPWFDNPEIRAPRLVPPIPLERIVARTTPIEGDAYRTLYITDALGTDAYRMKRVAEATQIPRTTLVTGEHTLRLFKFGRALQASYEQLRRQRVDRIAFILARMSIQAEVDKVSMVLSVLINGDGNSNTSAVVVNLTSVDPAATPGTLTLRGWTTFRLRFALTYMPDITLGQEASISQLLMLPVSSGVFMPLGMQTTPNPFGLIRPLNNQLNTTIDYGVTADAPTLKLVTFQSDIAAERVVEVGGNVSEVERFIADQTQLLTVTEVEGYGVIDPNATRILNINA